MRNRFAISQRQHQLDVLPLEELLQHEHRQFVEQVHIVDSHHDRGGIRSGGKRFDHTPHQLQAVAAGRACPRGQRTERKLPRRRGADHPPHDAAARRGGIESLGGDATFAHPRRTADDDPGHMGLRQRGVDEPHFLLATHQRPRQPHAQRVKQQLRAPQDNSCLAIPRCSPGSSAQLAQQIRHWATWCVSVGTQVVDAGENSRDQ